jgi:hypothetical protein
MNCPATRIATILPGKAGSAVLPGKAGPAILPAKQADLSHLTTKYHALPDMPFAEIRRPAELRP